MSKPGIKHSKLPVEMASHINSDAVIHLLKINAEKAQSERARMYKAEQEAFEQMEQEKEHLMELLMKQIERSEKEAEILKERMDRAAREHEVFKKKTVLKLKQFGVKGGNINII
jgi:hypothetical protein